MLQTAKTCLLLVTFLLPLTFRGWSETIRDNRPEVIVSVYDDAHLPVTMLAEAERKAARIFERAGVDVAWKNCSPNHVGPDALVRVGEQSSPGLEEESGQASSGGSNPAGLRPAGQVRAPAPTRFGSETSDCGSFEWPLHLALRVVARSRLSTSDVFGVAFLSAEGEGCYSDVFYDRAAALHADRHIGLPDILANVMAHELGHLLLGSNAHSSAGIMRAHWQNEELSRLSRGNLEFSDEQADHLRTKLNRVRLPVVLTARSY